MSDSRPETDLSEQLARLRQIIAATRPGEGRSADAARYEFLAHTMHEAMGLQDAAGVIVEVNPRLGELLGYQPEELIGRQVADFIAPEMIEVYRQSLETRRTVDPPPFRMTLRRKDGRRVIVLVAARPLRDAEGRYLGSFSLLTDITAREEAEEKLRRHAVWLDRFFDGNPYAIMVCDPQGRILRCNAGVAELFGALPPKDFCVFDDPVLRKIGLPEKLDEMRRGATLHFNSVCYNVNDFDPSLPNKPVCVTSAVFPIFDAAGQMECFVVMHQDVTAQWRAETAARRKQRLLERMLDVYERDRQLIAYDIHDGLVQQLTYARLQAETALSHLGQNRETAARLLAESIDGLRQASEEVRQVMAGLRPRVLEEAGLVAAIEELIFQQSSRGDAVIAFRHRLDATRLAPPLEITVYRIVQEALTNALRHSGTKRVRIDLERRGRRLRIAVRDWGKGFDLATAGRDRFGLSGIRERARLFGGRVLVQTAPGKGARILVDFPVVEAADKRPPS